MHGGKRNAHSISVVKPKGKMSLERARSSWEDTIKLDLKISEGRFRIGRRGVLF
jgi:hypothetical protein